MGSQSKFETAITFAVNGHADNDFYKYAYLFQILYSMNSVFLLKYMLRFWPRFFICKFDLNLKHLFYFFNKKYVLQKKCLYRKK